MDLSIATDIRKDPAAEALVRLIRGSEERLGLSDANLYYNFPLYRDEEEGGLISTKVLLVSPRHGVILFGTSTDGSLSALEREADSVDHIYSHIFARLLKNRRLRKSKQELVPPLMAAIYSSMDASARNIDDTAVVDKDRKVIELLEGLRWDAEEDLFLETVSTIEGAKGLIRPSKREIEDLGVDTKGRLAAQIEGEITTFDKRQKDGSIMPFEGPQRIRGLAGSGKTVVLAMKAAITHIRDPEAKILYTFWTKSLYQHVRRLITRFYRQFSDTDPNWDNLKVMHGWGSAALPGVYYTAAKSVGVSALTFQQASYHSANPFAFACTKLLESPIQPLYDYVFIDEGQDYPISFIQLCARLAKEDHFVIAYDELQTIFQAKPPSSADIFGVVEGAPKREFQDVVLHKCYRNPREILVCAHAVGFGIYGERIIQMLENQEHWEDIGYVVVEGDFSEGSKTVIERPEENSLVSISRQNTIDEMVCTNILNDIEQEIDWVAESIRGDLAQGLKAEDIVVISVDDRNAKYYLSSIANRLYELDIRTHNIHTGFGQVDFQEEGRVTLSTVHKAKGNEAFMVYVVGTDVLYPKPTIRQRNMLFTAMTRAKGWLRLSGATSSATALVDEINQAKKFFPRLEFVYPSAEQISVMRRDLEESASRRLRIERLLEEAAGDLTDEELDDLLKKRLTRGRGKKTRKSGKN